MVILARLLRCAAIQETFVKVIPFANSRSPWTIKVATQTELEAEDSRAELP